MNLRVARPELIVDINRIAGLDYVEAREGLLSIGALARHVDVKNSDIAARMCPAIRMAYEHVAHETVRNRGTFVGNIAHADSASEWPALMLVVDAEIVARSTRGQRIIAAEDFFVTAYTSDLEADEMLVEIRILPQPPGRRFGIEEFALRKGDLALSGVVVALDGDGQQCSRARLALFGVSDRPIRRPEAEQALVGSSCSPGAIAAAAELAVRAIEFEGAPGISADYRACLTRALICRALAKAWSPG
jgi:CO/xanthine dehydrogenase FAD-binding subunit